MRRSLLKLNGRHVPKALRQALVLLTILIAIPQGTWAVEYDLWIGGIQVTDDNASDVLGDGTVSYDGTFLNLGNAVINGDIVYNGDFNTFNINMLGANTVNRITYTGQQDVTLYVMRQNESTGSHSLTVTGNGTDAAISGFISECITENDFYDSGRKLYWKPTVTNDVITSIFITSDVFGGEGTEDSPYIISTPTQLKAFATKYNNEELALDCHVELGAVIDCTGLTGFEPIGTSDIPFIGTFDGKSTNDLYIKKLNCSLYSTGSCNGLFGFIDGGTVQDLKLSGCSFSEGDENGVIVGCMSSGTIQNCTVTDCSVSTSNTQSQTAGGIAGSMAGGMIEYCTVQNSSISATTNYSYGGGSTFAGGIVGKLHYSDGKNLTIQSCEVSNSTVTANNTNPDGMSAGGIYGAYEGSGTATITISNNEVKGKTQIICIDGCEDCDIDYSSAGAIGCPFDEGKLTLSSNTYEYTVTTKRKKGNADFTVGEGYTPRGIGGFFDTSEYEYVDGTDVTGSAEMYTRLVTLPDEAELATVMAVEGTYYGWDAEETGILVAPGQTVTLNASPDKGYVIASLTATNVTTEETIETESEELGDNITQYTFTMPDANATLNLTYTAKPSIWIGSVEVDENGTFPDIETVLFDSETKTLTLNGFGNGSDITSGLDELIIKVTGTTNQIGKIVSLNPAATLTFEKASADAAASLTLSTAQMAEASAVISGFASVDWGNMYLASSNPYQYDTTNKLLVNPTIEENNAITSATVTSVVTYPLWVGGVQITDGNKDAVSGIAYSFGTANYQSIALNKDGGSVTFNSEGNILTITDVIISSPNSSLHAPIINNLPNLEINFNGSCSLSGYQADYINDHSGGVLSMNSNAMLVFTSNNPDESTLQINDTQVIATGFKTIKTANSMIIMDMTSAGYYRIEKIKKPSLSIADGILVVSSGNDFYNLPNDYQMYYVITDADGVDGEEKTYTADTAELIDSPCSIEAWAEYQEQESVHTTGKYFGLADKTITFNKDTKGSELVIELSPATGDVNITGILSVDPSSGVISLDNDNKATITGIGSCDVTVKLSVNNDANFQVLNSVDGEIITATGSVTVIPDKPTIVKEEKEYLDTDKITITRTSVEGEVADNIKIFYTWNADAEVGSKYPHSESPILSIYDSTDKIPAQTGTLTLRAWVGYHLGDNEYLMSEPESQEFTVKTDIAKYTIKDLAASTPYTGAAITPTFKVVDQKETELANTNYTVSYQKVEITTDGEGADPTEKLTDVEEMVEVGSYKIVVTGTGDYGGSKSVDFEITKANLNIVTIEAIADQTYTGSAITLEEVTVTLNGEQVSSDEYEITYSNNTNVSTETEKATVTITATASSIHFTQSTTQTATFNIVAKALTAEMIEFSGDGLRVEDNSFIYNGQNQKPTVTVTDPDRGENGTVLEESTDYDIENEGGTNVGEYTVTITGKGNYSGSASKTFSITAKAIATEDITVTLSTESDLTYDGTEKKPAVTKVEIPGNDAPVELTTDDYDADNIVYENNINAGENTATATVTLKGNYSGTGVATFSIEQADLQYAAISKIAFGGKEYTVGDIIEIPYTGEAIQPTVEEVKFNDGTVTVDASDYNVSYSNNTEISSDDNLALIIITSTGKNFTEGTSTSQGFKIVRATVTITAKDQTVTYNADKQEYDISKVEVSNNNAKLAINYYATVDDRSNGENALTEAPTNADTYYVRVTLNEESQQHYVADPADVTFTIDQLEMTNSNTTITLDETELTYNGEAQTVNVTKVMVGEIEVPAECYEVSDNTATEAGTYTAKVTAKTKNADGSDFKNNFKGSATVDWKINHRTASAAELGFTSETQTASTYYNPNEDFNLPEGYVGYIVTGINGTNVLTTRVSYIQKGVAVLVEKGTSSANAIDEAPDPATLPLKGTSEPLEVSSIASGTVYVLYNGEFVKSTSGTIPGKRCYLLIESSVAAGTRAFGINHNMDANGIDSALFDDNDVKADDKWFNLQGRRIEKPTKAGIYVVNGKKVMINNK